MTATPWEGYSPPPPPSSRSGPMSMSVKPGDQLAQRDLNAPHNPALERARADARAAALAELRGDAPPKSENQTDAAAGEAPAVDPAPPYNPWSRYSQSYFPYTIRQNPGDNNALGHVKFLFPNHHSIDLHDTPRRKHFQTQTLSPGVGAEM